MVILVERPANPIRAFAPQPRHAHGQKLWTDAEQMVDKSIEKGSQKVVDQISSQIERKVEAKTSEMIAELKKPSESAQKTFENVIREAIHSKSKEHQDLVDISDQKTRETAKRIESCGWDMENRITNANDTFNSMLKRVKSSQWFALGGGILCVVLVTCFTIIRYGGSPLNRENALIYERGLMLHEIWDEIDDNFKKAIRAAAEKTRELRKLPSE